MFCIDQPTADAIRRAFDESGELAAIVEMRRYFPFVPAEHARNCVRAISNWQSRPLPVPRVTRKPGPSRRG